MVTLTFNSLGLLIAGVVIFSGLAMPIGIEQDEMGLGVSIRNCYVYSCFYCLCDGRWNHTYVWSLRGEER